MTNPSASKKSKTNTFWLAPCDGAINKVDCLCLGTGRFLRSVLVPALVQAGFHPALIQTRGRTMMDYMTTRDSSSFEVDTVLTDGRVETTNVPCYGAYSLGTKETKQAVYQELLPNMKEIKILGVGVTEAGLASSSTPVMHNLYELLQHVSTQFTFSEKNKLCIVDMDNVPNNGQVLKQHMLELAEKNQDDDMKQFLSSRVAFLDTMVDRITSQREGSNGMIPRCEPIPMKALVILDADRNLPDSIHQLPKDLGVVVRSTPQQLQADIALKLRIANGTHTALAHAMALCKLLKTDVLSSSDGELLMQYVDSLFQDNIAKAASVYGEDETMAAYEDWRGRLCHAHFGLSTFFITQNGAAKGGIRLGPTVTCLLQDEQTVTVTMAFAFAAILRWLTPCSMKTRDGVFRGWLDGSSPETAAASTLQGEEYADGLHHDLDAGWYEFKCACCIDGKPLSEWLAKLTATGPQQPQSYFEAICAYLTAPDGGNLSANLPGFDVFAQAVATLYARMVAGDGILNLLKEMNNEEGPYAYGLKRGYGFESPCSSIVDGASLANGRPLPYRVNPVPVSSKLLSHPVATNAMESVVVSEVASVKVIDLHTHLLPPSHGSLCCWGIDELLTYVSKS